MTDQRIRGATYDGHRIWYRIAGSGPALVLVRQNRVPADDRQLELLSDRFTVLQVTPIGLGSCERPAGYRPSGRIAPHILAAINQEGIDRFAVWATPKAQRWPPWSPRQPRGRWPWSPGATL